MNWFLVVLLVVFLVHLVVFSILGLKRREGYYLALVVTFSLLTASVLLRLLAPEWMWGEALASQRLRLLAWVAAAVSISWSLVRWIQRRRTAGST